MGKSNQSNTNERTIYKNKQQTEERHRHRDRQMERQTDRTAVNSIRCIFPYVSVSASIYL